MILALVIAQGIYGLKNRTCTVTSVIDGAHSRGSFHYLGLALDLRTNDLPPGEADEIVNMLRAALGQDYDVVLEKDHIHIEFQPKEDYVK